MDIDELRYEIKLLLDPEPDPEVSGRDIASARLTDVHGLDTTYLEDRAFTWEGSTIRGGESLR